MSYQIFVSQLDDLLLRLRDTSSPYNALGYSNVQQRPVQDDLSELIDDLADYAGSKGHVLLQNKLTELRIVSAENNVFPNRMDKIYLEARILRVQRVLNTVGAEFVEGYSNTDISIALPERQSVGKSIEVSPISTNKIFIVHGHDRALLQEVTRLIEKFGFRPVVLSEQPNEGKTLIEKFESNADVGFAIILMTKDDMGASIDDAERKAFQPRARQNVILELGYFTGILGRSRVCVLKASDVEQPSDIIGIVYTAIDGGGAWRLSLGQELKAAGYDVDLNRLVS